MSEKSNNTDSQNSTAVSSHYLHIAGQDGSEIQRGLSLSDVDVIQAKAGEQYRVILKNESLADDVAAVRTGDNLDVHFEDGPHLVIEDYFLVCTDAECGITLAAENEEGVLIRANDPAAQVSSESLVFYSHGDVNSTFLALAEKGVLVEPAKILDADPTSPESTEAGLSSTALLGLGAAVLGSIGHVTSSGGASAGLPAAPVAAPTPEPVTYTFTVSLGPVLASNTELTIRVFRADGTLLGETSTFDAATGTFSFTDTSGYTGVVIARLIDAGSGADYLDEATGAELDAPNDLLAVGNVEGGSISLSLTPLTSVAAAKLGVSVADDSVTGSESLTSTDVDTANSDVAEAFGIAGGDVVRDKAQLVIDADGNPQAGDAYGVALALVSALEVTTGKSTEAVIQDIALNLDGANLSETIRGELVAAADEAGITPAQVTEALNYAPAESSLLSLIGVDANDGDSSGVNDAGFSAALLNGIQGVSGAVDSAYYLAGYQSFIEQNLGGVISNPAQVSEIQALIDTVNQRAIPRAPTIEADIDGSVPVSDTTPTLIGDGGVAGETVTLFGSDGSTVLGTSTVSAEGTWAITSSVLADAEYSFTVRYTDVSGNSSALSPAVIVTITGAEVLIEPPPLPGPENVIPTSTITVDSIDADSGSASADFITNDSNGLTIAGTISAALAAGEVLEYSNDNGATFSNITSSVTGTAISYVDANLTSTNTVQFRVTNSDGNSGTVATQLITIDTTAPTSTVTINSITTDSGSSSSDFITNDSDGVTVNGTLSTGLATGEILEYSNDNGASFTDITSSVSGTAISYVDSALTSSNTVQFRVTD
ncbi:MAG: hypothetical protein ACI82A_002694, partial [Candidatus Azotimanducaceae bacterium]